MRPWRSHAIKTPLATRPDQLAVDRAFSLKNRIFCQVSCCERFSYTIGMKNKKPFFDRDRNMHFSHPPRLEGSRKNVQAYRNKLKMARRKERTGASQGKKKQ